MTSRIPAALVALVIVLAACGGGEATNGDDGGERTPPTIAVSTADGKALYDGTCVACHAEGGTGIEGLGKPLAGSEFVQGTSDTELVEFIATGRDTSDPANTTGVAMPPKGGNPALTDADLEAIVAYLRTLQ